MPTPAPSVNLALTEPTIASRTSNRSWLLDHRGLLISLFIVGFIAWFGGLELRGLFFPDEGRYAEIPLGMLTTGDWITPRLNGIKYFEKPPLQYWATATIYSLLGTDEWTARLWPALTGFAGILGVGAAGARLYGARTAVVAMGVLISSWAYFLGGQYLTLDMGLTFFLTVSLMSFLWAQQDDTAPRARRNAMWVTWVALAMAVLSKGLVALVLPTLTLVGYSASVRSVRIWQRMHLLSGLALLTVIAVPWFVAAQLQNVEFFQLFFIQEHFQRFASEGHHRLGPWYYFIVIGVVGMLPWSAAWSRCIRAMPSLLRRPPNTAFQTDRFLLIWILVIFVFFSVSKSKLPAYVLPAFPALALLVAHSIVAAPEREVGFAAVLIMVLGWALLVAIPFADRWDKVQDLGAAFDTSRMWSIAAAIALVVGGTAAWMLRRSRVWFAFGVVAIANLLFWHAVNLAFSQVDDLYSSEQMIERLTDDQRPFAPNAPFFSLGSLDQSVPFYLGRPVTLVADKSELREGIKAEPEKYVASLPSFIERWNAASHAYAIMSIHDYEALLANGVVMRQVERDRRRVIVARS